MLEPCRYCGAHRDEQFPFCKNCGMGFSDSFRIECETHDHCSAVGVCTVCLRPVCNVCKKIDASKNLCLDPLHTEFAQHWQPIWNSDSEFEADAIQQNLRSEQIESAAFSLYRYSAAIGLPSDYATVWVKQTDVQHARTLLENLHLLTNENQIHTHQ